MNNENEDALSLRVVGEHVFRPKREWVYLGEGFNATVKWWPLPSLFSPGNNKWNIYLEVYRGTELFQRLARCNRDKFLSDLPAKYVPPFHGGCTYFTRSFGRVKWDKPQEQIVSYKLGCDYGHLGDDLFSLDTVGGTVFEDASELIEWAKENVKPIKSEQH